ncbi:AAA-type ATPase [Macleaya cordata]|uniref:AAA-type ATPase n=1 Tax=Macleaya cordata TaxID=56857 RepID=A0A200QN95_MACCD|nr:AAA-type ATPase [Macleaya cordata]
MASSMIERHILVSLLCCVSKFLNRILSFLNPNIQITFHEFTSEPLNPKNEAFVAIEAYLSSKLLTDARRLKGQIFKNGKNLILSLDEHEEVSDLFDGNHMSWILGKTQISAGKNPSFSAGPDEQRFFVLKFHKKHRELVSRFYLGNVVESGKVILAQNRRRKLYTNKCNIWNKAVWVPVNFDHPATFDNLAIDREETIRVDCQIIKCCWVVEFLPAVLCQDYLSRFYHIIKIEP